MYYAVTALLYISLDIYTGDIPHRGLHREPFQALENPEGHGPKRGNTQNNAALPIQKERKEKEKEKQKPLSELSPLNAPTAVACLHPSITAVAFAQYWLRQYSDGSSQFCLLPRPPNSCAASMQYPPPPLAIFVSLP
jgi:hypothetical protein